MAQKRDEFSLHNADWHGKNLRCSSCQMNEYTEC